MLQPAIPSGNPQLAGLKAHLQLAAATRKAPNPHLETRTGSLEPELAARKPDRSTRTPQP